MADRSLNFSVAVDDGKYTVESYNDGRLIGLRHGEPWQDLAGNNLVYNLASELNEARKRIQQLEVDLQATNKATPSTAVVFMAGPPRAVALNSYSDGPTTRKDQLFSDIPNGYVLVTKDAKTDKIKAVAQKVKGAEVSIDPQQWPYPGTGDLKVFAFVGKSMQRGPMPKVPFGQTLYAIDVYNEKTDQHNVWFTPHKHAIPTAIDDFQIAYMNDPQGATFHRRNDVMEVINRNLCNYEPVTPETGHPKSRLEFMCGKPLQVAEDRYQISKILKLDELQTFAKLGDIAVAKDRITGKIEWVAKVDANFKESMGKAETRIKTIPPGQWPYPGTGRLNTEHYEGTFSNHPDNAEYFHGRTGYASIIGNRTTDQYMLVHSHSTLVKGNLLDDVQKSIELTYERGKDFVTREQVMEQLHKRLIGATLIPMQSAVAIDPAGEKQTPVHATQNSR
jgi:hypothetical protein